MSEIKMVTPILEPMMQAIVVTTAVVLMWSTGVKVEVTIE